MILHHLKAIFIHIPRTGGTSIETFFNQRLRDHSVTSDVVSQIGQDTWDSYFKFSFVRNPWDRFVSMFHIKELRGQVQKSFGEWLEVYLHETHNRTQHQNDLRCSQHYWLYVDGKPIVDFVGRFEHLHEDFQEILKKLNVNGRLPHIGGTQHKHYAEYYDDRTREIVANRCQLDIETFGYTFSEQTKLL